MSNNILNANNIIVLKIDESDSIVRCLYKETIIEIHKRYNVRMMEYVGTEYSLRKSYFFAHSSNWSYSLEGLLSFILTGDNRKMGIMGHKDYENNK